MSSVEELLSNNLLEASVATTFEESRRRVAQRHADWRTNFPAIGLLLDTDEERAHALAGNYATEIRETIGVWLSAQESGADGDLDDEARAAWVEAVWSTWREEVFALDEVSGLDSASLQRFTGVFDELMVRFRDETTTFIREGGARGKSGPGIVGRLLAPFRAVGRGLRGFFFPSLRG